MGWGKLILALGAYQVAVTTAENVRMMREARAARAYANMVQRPLLVVGGPHGYNDLRTTVWPVHECGDVCADIDQAPCTGCTWVEADVRSLPFTDKYFGAALCSHVLEHMETPEDAALAWQELHRVADRVWAPTPSKLNPWAWLNPRHHLWVSVEGEELYISRM